VCKRLNGAAATWPKAPSTETHVSRLMGLVSSYELGNESAQYLKNRTCVLLIRRLTWACRGGSGDI
jgi:hypothetical protein